MYDLKETMLDEGVIEIRGTARPVKPTGFPSAKRYNVGFTPPATAGNGFKGPARREYIIIRAGFALPGVTRGSRCSHLSARRYPHQVLKLGLPPLYATLACGRTKGDICTTATERYSGHIAIFPKTNSHEKRRPLIDTLLTGHELTRVLTLVLAILIFDTQGDSVTKISIVTVKNFSMHCMQTLCLNGLSEDSYESLDVRPPKRQICKICCVPLYVAD
ncbi:hypothetical protein WN51_10772 [Melipona quadrifasciata]|uniref:Uncharacterized protein n=1 Tax=Melipona quadrifasciata TaxID=166423 RepID=A0A0M9A5K2_9HYME|nr:hypothetical protein WN51_10772 [Melipona quadrifasciata]